MPCVQHTAACSGLRPVAKALGLMVGATYSRGMGWPALVDSSRTTAYITGCCSGVTSMAPIERTASLSEFQYV